METTNNSDENTSMKLMKVLLSCLGSQMKENRKWLLNHYGSFFMEME